MMHESWPIAVTSLVALAALAVALWERHKRGDALVAVDDAEARIQGTVSEGFNALRNGIEEKVRHIAVLMDYRAKDLLRLDDLEKLVGCQRNDLRSLQESLQATKAENLRLHKRAENALQMMALRSGKLLYDTEPIPEERILTIKHAVPSHPDVRPLTPPERAEALAKLERVIETKPAGGNQPTAVKGAAA